MRRLTGLSGGRHTKIELESDGITLTGLCFGTPVSSLEFEAGYKIDVLFNLDVNTYRNQNNVQLIIQDARISESFTARISEEESRYAQILNGSEYSYSENIIPEHADFAAVYRILRREYGQGREIIDIKNLILQAYAVDMPLNYIKLKYILKIMNELGICNIETLDADIIRFSVPGGVAKTSIDKSAILKKLIGQCADRNVSSCP